MVCSMPSAFYVCLIFTDLFKTLRCLLIFFQSSGSFSLLFVKNLLKLFIIFQCIFSIQQTTFINVVDLFCTLLDKLSYKFTAFI